MVNRRRRDPRDPDVLRGAIAGAVAGMVGAWAMVRFNHLIGPDDGRGDKPVDAYAHRRISAQPNDTDGTLPDEPGSSQAAAALARPLIGRTLTERQKEAAGPLVHYLFGALAGASYGAAAEVSGTATRGAGIPYGIGVWLVADEIGMHAAGFATRPTDYPLSRHAATLATHIVFGLTVEAVRSALRYRLITGGRKGKEL